MASIQTWVAWFWPSILLLLLGGLSLAIPGGPEMMVVIGLVGLQFLVIFLRVILWLVAEANARSAQ